LTYTAYLLWVGFYKGEEVAKKADSTTPKSGRIKRTLGKRVELTKSPRLSRDVKTPRWLRAIGRYVRGSWQELRAVRWPTRRVTWAQTLAVILFTLAMVAFILALDYGFDLLFKQVILS
jgi:preprotein translocase SecE subunit